MNWLKCTSRLSVRTSSNGSIDGEHGNDKYKYSACTFLTPALTYLYLRTSVSVDVKSMFVSIIEVVLVPIGLGLLINKLFGKYTQRIMYAMPTVSVTAICLIVAAVVSHNSEKINGNGSGSHLFCMA